MFGSLYQGNSILYHENIHNHIIISVILFFTKAQAITKDKEFYVAVIYGGYEGVFILSPDTVTKGTIILYLGGIWADTIPFIIQTPHP